MRIALSAGKGWIRVFSVLGPLLVIIAATVSGSGQETDIKVEIPFNFIVGATTLPAGEYTVSKVPSQDRLLIQSIDGRRSIVAFTTLTQGTVDKEEAGLVFNQYGEEYFISQALSQGTSEYTFLVSRRERKLIAAAKYPTKNTFHPERVVVTSAQSNLNISIAIPFSFVVKDELLPSGNYTIRCSPEGESLKLMIQSVDGFTTQSVATNQEHRLMSSSLALVFNQYGGIHFLSQVWAEGSSIGYELNKTEAEIKFAKKAKLSNDAEQLQVVSIPLR
jgi:hypothetical protein